MLCRMLPLLLVSKIALAADPLVLEDPGLRINTSQDKAWLRLSPLLRLAPGGWMEAAPGACHTEENTQTCDFPGQGQLMVRVDGPRVRLEFQASRALQLQSLGLGGTLQLPAARGFLSHGFQSWSQTGVVQLRPEPAPGKLEEALQKTGEDEVYRRGQEFSWWYSYIGSDALSFLAGASTADTLKSYVQFSRVAPDQYGVRLISGAGERVLLQAGSRIGESWTLALGPDLQQHLDAYAASLSSRRRAQPRPSQVGWNSWYDLWDDVKESDFIANIPLVQSFWKDRLPATAGPLTMTLDDGWEQAWGDWYPNSKFPSGIDGLAQKLAGTPVQLGLWLAPLLVHPDSRLAQEHPDWLVQKAVYLNPAGVAFRVLDVSQPAVAEHLQATIRRLVGWGARVLKIDFLFAGALEGERSKTWTGMQAYREALRLIREAAGEDIVLVAVGAPPLVTFDYVDAWRVGGDIAFKPSVFGLPRPGPNFIANQARAVAGRQPYCQVTLCDADPALLRTLSRESVSAGAWVVAATGGAMVLSDHLPRLPRKRWDWAYDAKQLQNGLSGQPARLKSYFPARIPSDLNNMKDKFFTAPQEVPEVWLYPDGSRVLLNFSSQSKRIEGLQVPKNGSRVLP